jgi:ElaB/YqjD/DUF883 family membrane-anchored ribosome-binding protein
MAFFSDVSWKTVGVAIAIVFVLLLLLGRRG